MGEFVPKPGQEPKNSIEVYDRLEAIARSDEPLHRFGNGFSFENIDFKHILMLSEVEKMSYVVKELGAVSFDLTTGGFIHHENIKKVQVASNPEPQGNFFDARLNIDQNNHFAEGTINIIHPHTPVAQEEILHALDYVARDFIIEKIGDSNIKMAVREAAHLSLLIDYVLTYAAVELGDFNDWYLRSIATLLSDGSDIVLPENQVFRVIKPLFSSTAKGKLANMRFQYPYITREFLADRLLATSQGLEQYWMKQLTHKGKVVGEVVDHNFVAALELAMLSYGLDELTFAYDLLDLQGETPEEMLEGAVNLAKLVLQNAKGYPSREADLVRHQKPLRKLPDQYALGYELPESILQTCKDAMKRNLPVLMKLNEFKHVDYFIKQKYPDSNYRQNFAYMIGKE